MTPSRVFNAALSVSFALLLDAQHARAQNVPAVSVDFDAGSGSTSSGAGDNYFRTTNSAWISADLAIRVGGAGPLRPVVVVGYSFRGLAGDQTTDCPLAPNGGCKIYFPSTYGPSIGVGLRQALGKWVLLGATAGVASYASEARFAEFDASLELAPHLAVVSEFRYIDLPVGSARAWFTPLTFGARLSW
jgi:hypothetical protein